MYVKKLHNRGANIVVEANGEVMFTPGAEVGRWSTMLRERVAAAAIAGAPHNKRPRWGHYGAPLKSTIKRTAKYQASRLKIYLAVGSSSPHSYYVDQGTGVYAGNGPYEARILPPWNHGGASLYEATWRPGGPGTPRVAPVMIKGQKGQFFFDAAIKAGFKSMRLRSFQLPGEGAGAVADAIKSMPSGLSGFLGNTPDSPAFRASLAEWRAWRDDAWANGEGLGRGGGIGSRAQQRFRDDAREAARARHEDRPENVRAYEASIAASKARLAAERERLRKERERLAAGAAKRDEDRRKREAAAQRQRERNALRRGNEAMKAEAAAFFERIKHAYPDATLRSTTLADGVIAYRVTYVMGGETIRQTFAYGYST